MWVPSISTPNLSLIGALSTEIYHQTEITGNAHRQTHIETESDILPKQVIGSSKEVERLEEKLKT